jgi:hypothetical protein
LQNAAVLPHGCPGTLPSFDPTLQKFATFFLFPGEFQSGDNEKRGCQKVVDVVFKTLSPFSGTSVLEQKLGGNVVDFVFKTFVSIITSLGYVGNKPC